MESIQEHFEKSQRLVDSLLTQTLENLLAPPRLLQAMVHSTQGGGKRFRPLLVFSSCEIFSVSSEYAARVAVAIELLHCFSLVHDDLPAMDNSLLRRGKPSCWNQFDQATAVLTGDSLLTLSFEILAQTATHPDPLVRLDLIQRLAQASGAEGMAGGQMLDMTPNHTLEKVIKMQVMKTGELIAFCCEAGAIMVNETFETRQILKEIGYNIGLIYQITDDLLDQEGNSQDMGKPILQDQDKITVLSLLGKSQALDMLQESKVRIENNLKSLNQDTTSFLGIVDWVCNRSY